MTRQKLVQKIFEEALNAPDAQRSVLIRDRCQGDRSLETEVIRLVEAHQTTDRVFDAPTADALGSLVSPGYLGEAEAPHTFSAGSLIANRFEILRFLIAAVWERFMKHGIRN